MDDHTADSAFLDIAANLLAVILIVTLFSLLAVQSRLIQGEAPDGVLEPELPFETPRRELFPPFSRFYFVLEDRLIPWDERAVQTALERGVATTPQGQLRWRAQPLALRDIDAYTLSFRPDPQALKAQQQPFDPQAGEALVEEWRQEYQQSRRAPTFIVYPSGMEAFAALYPQLEAIGLPFRWFPFPENRPLEVGRYPQQFTDYGIYW
ncbi:MAG: hypothetical protein R3310_13130 [Candidatus Competibacteraceae bacterium]|nr:hypothetical protein [Candidatus Competibacteraceae bacterium]